MSNSQEVKSFCKYAKALAHVVNVDKYLDFKDFERMFHGHQKQYDIDVKFDNLEQVAAIFEAFISIEYPKAKVASFPAYDGICRIEVVHDAFNDVGYFVRTRRLTNLFIKCFPNYSTDEILYSFLGFTELEQARKTRTAQ
jgi:hypothetical protein